MDGVPSGELKKCRKVTVSSWRAHKEVLITLTAYKILNVNEFISEHKHREFLSNVFFFFRFHLQKRKKNPKCELVNISFPYTSIIINGD